MSVVFPQPLQPVLLARPARSRLAANQLLFSLSSAFGSTSFTSRQVSMRLNLDFLYTAKMLHRLRKRYLLSVERTSRSCGGYENTYSITPKGRRKIEYIRRLRGQSGSPANQLPRGPNEASPTESPGDQWLRLLHLLMGHGRIGELVGVNFLKAVLGSESMGIFEPGTDKLGSLLKGVDPRLLILDFGISIFPDLFPTDSERLMVRGMALQHLELIPKDICLPVYADISRSLGSTDTETLIALLLRGGMRPKREIKDLREQLDESRSELRATKLKVESNSESWRSNEEESRKTRLLKEFVNGQAKSRAASHTESLTDALMTTYKGVSGMLQNLENTIRTTEELANPYSLTFNQGQVQDRNRVDVLMQTMNRLKIDVLDIQGFLDKGTELCIRDAERIKRSLTP